MSVSRRWLACIVAVVTLVQLSVSPAFAVFTSSCDTAQVGGLKYTNERGRSNPGIDGAIIELDARQLVPCTPGVLGSFSSVSASIQSSLTTQTNIVHIGIIRCSKPGGCGGEIGTGVGKVPDDGRLHFFFTKYDSGSGRIFLADGWYGGAPQIGQRYRMKVQRLASSWGYYIRNVSAGQAYVSVGRSATWAGGTYSWWGGEVHSAGDAMGNRDTDSDLDSQTQYLRGGSWYVMNGADQICVKRKDDVDLVFPSYYRCSFVTTSSPSDTMRNYTLDHASGDVP